MNANRGAAFALLTLLMAPTCVDGGPRAALPPGLREAFEAEVEIVEYRGLCDASAVAWIDAERFAVAGDEDNWLRIYRLSVPEPEELVALGTFLAVDEEHSEGDLEAAAPHGDLVYWIGSHGRNKRGEPRPSRSRLFATSLGGAAISPAGRAYAGLLADLLADERYAAFDLATAARRAPQSRGALNLEGLVSWNDALLVGARNPIPDGDALLIPIRNAEAVVRDGVHAVFGEPLRLDLDGRGVRALERFGRWGYLISAGSASGPADRLYLWDGERDGAAVRVADPALNVEGLAYAAGAARLLLVSDDGSFLVHGSRCKETRDVSERRFRVQVIDFKGLQ